MIIGSPIITGADFREYYTGDYTIDPTTFPQVLPVSGKTMSRDITINAYRDGAAVSELIARNIEGYEDTNGEIRSVGSYAFQGCSFLRSVNFPAASKIGSFAFSECSTLRRISAPAVEKIFEGAFYNCQYLASAIFPSVNAIGSSAFANCYALSSVDCPEALQIGQEAFYACRRCILSVGI